MPHPASLPAPASLPSRAPRTARSGGRPLRGLALAVALLASGPALGGCGGSDGTSPAPQVASLPSPAAASGSAAGGTEPRTTKAPDDTGRPQERLDDTPEQRDRLIHAWDSCLLAHGATTGGSGPAAPDGTAAQTIKEPVPTAAKEACMDRLPLYPPELDPSLNKNYREDTQAQLACIREHGFKVHLVSETSLFPNGLSWALDDGYPEVPAGLDKAADDCELKAFGEKK